MCGGGGGVVWSMEGVECVQITDKGPRFIRKLIFFNKCTLSKMPRTDGICYIDIT